MTVQQYVQWVWRIVWAGVVFIVFFDAYPYIEQHGLKELLNLIWYGPRL